MDWLKGWLSRKKSDTSDWMRYLGRKGPHHHGLVGQLYARDRHESADYVEAVRMCPGNLLPPDPDGRFAPLAGMHVHKDAVPRGQMSTYSSGTCVAGTMAYDDNNTPVTEANWLSAIIPIRPEAPDKDAMALLADIRHRHRTLTEAEKGMVCRTMRKTQDADEYRMMWELLSSSDRDPSVMTMAYGALEVADVLGRGAALRYVWRWSDATERHTLLSRFDTDGDLLVQHNLALVQAATDPAAARRRWERLRQAEALPLEVAEVLPACMTLTG